MPSEEHLAELEARIAASLKRTGQTFILVWPIVIALVWAASNYPISWLHIAATAASAGMLFLVCLPNIGRLTSLNKINFGALKPLRNQLGLAYLGALLLIYAAVALLFSLPGPVLATSAAFAVALINSYAV